MADQIIAVEVVYAMPEQQKIVELEISEGSSIEQAIIESGLLLEYPEIDLENFEVGIFGKVLNKAQLVKSGDRIEIYRALIQDPKEARRNRAAGKQV
jgi:putative ubiquitin-RnfH superfamily antitoxin RatB of RatAB toxin-antitoxin module